MRFDVFYEVQKARLERLLPWIVATLTAALYWWFLRPRAPTSNVKDLLQAALNIAAIGVGFLISAKSILLTIAGSRVIRQLKSNGAYGRLIGFFISGIWWGALAMLISACLLWLDFCKMSNAKEILLMGWMFVCGGAGGAAGRVIWLFSKIVRVATSDDFAATGR